MFRRRRKSRYSGFPTKKFRWKLSVAFGGMTYGWAIQPTRKTIPRRLSLYVLSTLRGLLYFLSFGSSRFHCFLRNFWSTHVPGIIKQLWTNSRKILNLGQIPFFFRSLWRHFYSFLDKEKNKKLARFSLLNYFWKPPSFLLLKTSAYQAKILKVNNKYEATVWPRNIFSFDLADPMQKCFHRNLNNFAVWFQDIF